MDDVKGDPKPAINTLKLGQRHRYKLSPQREILGITSLETRRFFARLVVQMRLNFRASFEALVQALQLSQRIAGVGLVIPPATPRHDELSEGRAPVTDVVVGDNPPTQVGV